MKTTLVGVVVMAVGILSMIGGATGSPLLVAMFGGMRGRAPNTVMTRAGMGIGGLLALAFGGLLASGYVGGSATAP